MSDVGGSGLPPYTPKSGGTGLWARFLASPIWVKIAVPVAIVLLAVFVGVLISRSDDSSSESEEETEELLEELAEELADEEAAASTTTVPRSPRAETTTTVAETTTTVAETTTTIATTTTVPATTTTVPPTTVPATTTTTVPPTTVPPTTTTTTTTVPATTTTTTTTTTPTTTTPPTTEPPPTEPPTTEPPPTEPPPTEAPPTEAPPTEPPDTGRPPGSLFASLDDLQSAWNATAQGSSVAQISSWTPMTVLDRAVNVANLGGNLRLAAITGDDGFVSHVVLAWLPLADESQQPQQNVQFQDAFAVLVRTVNPAASSSQQADLASQLGLSSEQPPFPEGAEGRATLVPDRYQLEVVDIPGQDGPTTLIAATSADPR